MKNKKRDLYIFIGIAALFVFFIFKAQPILMPFVSSLVLSYLLNPVVTKLKDKYDITRATSSALILSLFLIIFLTILFVLLPIIYRQFLDFVSLIPLYFESVVKSIYPTVMELASRFGFEAEYDVSELLARENMAQNFIKVSHNFANNILSSTLDIVNIFSLIFILPLLVFYILKDWDSLLETINNHLPKSSKKDIQNLISNIDTTLSSYLRGQFNVCLILGAFYAILLSISGLKFGFIIGLLTGLFSFIPYVGMLLGVIIALIVAIFQWGFDPINYSIVALIFVAGQAFEGSFLTPRLIGSKIGVHDAWVIFGVFFFGAWLGFTGVLIAVPLTAVISTTIKYFLVKYRKKYT